MKLSLHYLILVIFFGIQLEVAAQSIFQNAFLTNYLNHTLTTKSAVSLVGELPYDGIGKNDLLYEVPNTVISGFRYDFGVSSLVSPMNGVLRASPPMVNNQLGIEFFGSLLSEMQLTLTNQNIKGRWSNQNVVSGYRNQNIQDRNEDGFRDLPTKDRLFALTKHQWSKNRLTTSLNVFYLNVDEVNGQTGFDKTTDFLTTNAYGFGNQTEHSGFVFLNEIKLGKLEKSVKHQLNLYADGRLHDQSAFFGQKEMFSNENLFNTFIEYERDNIISSFAIGAAYRQQNINIDFNSNTYAQNYDIDRLSVFASYDTYVFKYGKIEANGRLEYENEQIGFYPNIQVTTPFGRQYNRAFSMFNFFAGREKRLFLPTQEYGHYLNSSRIVDFPELNNDNYYESGYYLGAAWQMNYANIYVNWGFGNSDLRFRRTKLILRQQRLTNYWIPTVYEPSALYNGSVIFQEGTGLWDQTILEGSTQIGYEGFELKASYRFTRPDKDYDYQLTPKHIWALRLSRFRIIHSLSSSISYFYQGKQIFNGSGELTNGTHRWDWMVRWRIGEVFRMGDFSGTSIVFGINNFTNNRKNNLIINPEDPFSPLYDGSADLGQQFNTTFFIGAKLIFD